MNTKTPPVLTSPSRARLLGSRGRQLVLVAVVVVVAGFVLWNWLAGPREPWRVRWSVQRYLKKQARTGDFKVEFTFPSKAEMAQAPAKPGRPAKRAMSAKDFETLLDEYYALKGAALVLEREMANSAVQLPKLKAQVDELARQIADGTTANQLELAAELSALRDQMAAWQKKAAAQPDLEAKEAALAPIVSALWDYHRARLAEKQTPEALNASSSAADLAKLKTDTRQKLSEAGSYSEMYKLIGQETWVASQLLDSANPAHRRAGVNLAMDAARQAMAEPQNGWVAARICEGYVLPNLDLADDLNPRSPFHADTLLTACADIFRGNNEFDNVVRTYQIFLARGQSATRTDWARAQIAMAYDSANDPKHALQYIRKIQATNNFSWLVRNVPRLEQQLKNR